MVSLLKIISVNEKKKPELVYDFQKKKNVFGKIILNLIEI